MLEPVDEVAVLVPDDLVGTVMGDLSGRRGHVLGSEPVRGERTLVRAEVPQTEMIRYSIDLRAVEPRRRQLHRGGSPATSRCRTTWPPSSVPRRSVLAGRRGAAPAGCGRAQVALAVLDELVVGRLPHQLDQLALVGDVDGLPGRCGPRCCPSSTSRGRARRDPSHAGRTHRSRPRCTRCRRGARRRGRCDAAAAASRRPAWSPRSAGPRAAPGRAGHSPRRRRSRAG